MSKKEEQKEELPAEAGLSAEDAEIEAAAVKNANPEIEDIKEVVKKLQFTVHFPEPYIFEGEEFNELDLSPIQDLTTIDLMGIDKIFTSLHRAIPTTRYTDTQYVEILVMKALNKPAEFFNRMKAKDFSQIMAVVGLYFLL